MESLLYISRATHAFRESEFGRILETAERTNQRMSVTGMLLYGSGTFAQVLEGKGHAIDELMKRIERDPRHSNILVLSREVVLERTFSKWAMGGHTLPEGQKPPGLEGISANARFASESGLKVVEFMRAFYRDSVCRSSA